MFVRQSVVAKSVLLMSLPSTASKRTSLPPTEDCDTIPHEMTSWLHDTAEQLLKASIMPTESDDTVYLLHRSLLYTGFVYQDLRAAIRYEEEEHVIRHWKLWLPLFLGNKCHNYACEAVNLIANLKADYPKHIAHIVTHNRTVNVHGIASRGKPIDQMVKHYNLLALSPVDSTD